MPPPPNEIKQLYQSILDDVEELTARIIHVIRADIPEYQQFPYEIHYADNLVNLTLQLQRLASGDGPQLRAVEHAREMARTRVDLNVPLAQAIAGYHIGFRELWAEVVRRAGTNTALQVMLPMEVERIWSWFHLVSSAYSEEYMLASRTRALTRADSLRRLLSEPAASGAAPHLDDLVADLGYDAARAFRAFVATAQPVEIVARLNADLAGLRSPAYAVTAGQHTVVVSQDLTAVGGAELLRRCGVRGPVGVGLARHGAGGIRESFVDGTRLLQLPDGEQDVREFEREWPLTLLYADRARMRELLAVGVSAAREHEHIAQVVVAFATSGYSISATARALHIHPNTARYRITRWRELTGWDLFTVRGLLSSLAALQDAESGIAPADLG